MTSRRPPPRDTTPADDSKERRGWHLSRTISLDSVIVLIASIVSGLVFLLTMNSKISQQEQALANVEKLIERVDADHKERVVRLEEQEAKRSDRLEAAIKEQATIIQTQVLPKLRR